MAGVQGGGGGGQGNDGEDSSGLGGGFGLSVRPLGLFVLDGVVFGGVVLWRRRATLARDLPPMLLPATVGGALSITAYGIVVWAMSVAPMVI